ncbi:hypothetical protein BDW71DRAFT_175239 [Aspergillus fruticulosus]
MEAGGTVTPPAGLSARFIPRLRVPHYGQMHGHAHLSRKFDLAQPRNDKNDAL